MAVTAPELLLPSVFSVSGWASPYTEAIDRGNSEMGRRADAPFWLSRFNQWATAMCRLAQSSA